MRRPGSSHERHEGIYGVRSLGTLAVGPGILKRRRPQSFGAEDVLGVHAHGLLQSYPAKGRHREAHNRSPGLRLLAFPRKRPGLDDNRAGAPARARTDESPNLRLADPHNDRQTQFSLRKRRRVARVYQPLPLAQSTNGFGLWPPYRSTTRPPVRPWLAKPLENLDSPEPSRDWLQHLPRYHDTRRWWESGPSPAFLREDAAQTIFAKPLLVPTSRVVLHAWGQLTAPKRAAAPPCPRPDTTEVHPGPDSTVDVLLVLRRILELQLEGPDLAIGSRLKGPHHVLGGLEITWSRWREGLPLSPYDPHDDRTSESRVAPYLPLFLTQSEGVVELRSPRGPPPKAKMSPNRCPSDRRDAIPLLRLGSTAVARSHDEDRQAATATAWPEPVIGWSRPLATRDSPPFNSTVQALSTSLASCGVVAASYRRPTRGSHLIQRAAPNGATLRTADYPTLVTTWLRLLVQAPDFALPLAQGYHVPELHSSCCAPPEAQVTSHTCPTDRSGAPRLQPIPTGCLPAARGKGPALQRTLQASLDLLGKSVFYSSAVCVVRALTGQPGGLARPWDVIDLTDMVGVGPLVLRKPLVHRGDGTHCGPEAPGTIGHGLHGVLQ